MIAVINPRSVPVYLADGSVVAGKERRMVARDDHVTALIAAGRLVPAPATRRRKRT